MSGAAPAAAAADEHADASLDDSAKLDPNATPPAAWRAYSPSLAPAPGGREHRVTLTATQGVLEVAPGVEQQAWSFDGKVPGPALRGKVGDLFTITLVNDPRNKLGHSIDFHASKVAWNDEMRTINPGERLVYQFKAKHAGIYLYHCGTAPTLHHIGNGMYGAIVVDPPDLAKIVGTVFDTTYKEGEYLLRPGFGRGGSQVLDLQPAQGGFVSSASTSRACTRS